jgi:hypothetical protein
VQISEKAQVQGHESWIYGHGPRTKQQSSQWKKEQRQELAHNFDITGIVQK